MMFKPVENSIIYSSISSEPEPEIGVWGVRETPDHPVGLCISISSESFSLEFVLDVVDVEAALERGKSFAPFRM